MKFREKISSTLYSMKNSIKRFPVTVFVSIIFVIVQIYINEHTYQPDLMRETYNRISMIIGMAIPLSLCLGFISEVFFNKDKVKQTLSYIIGLIILVLYYIFFLKDFTDWSYIRYTGTIISLILALFYIPRLKRKENFEFHVLSLNNSIAITFIYSAVLYLGIIAILFTIDRLFDIKIDGKYYYYTFLIITFIFGVSLFISKLDSYEEDYLEYDLSSALKILLIYIIIPLISIYTLILYIYFAQIVLTRQWPRGLVSNLVLWYSTLSVFIIFLITPILEENKIAKTFKLLFPKLVLPILLMMFVSMYQRVNQYGITENRYFIIVLGLWVTLIMIYFSLIKQLRNIIIPITLSLIILISVYGPLSAYKISIISQNNRLNSLLTNNGFLLDGSLIKKDNVSKQEQREISNAIEYFNNKNALEYIKVFPNDFKTIDTDRILGFTFKPQIYGNYEDDNYFNYYLDQMEIALDVSDYDYYAKVSSWSNEPIKIGDMELLYEGKEDLLKLSKEGITLFEEDMELIALSIHNKLNDIGENNKEGNKLEDMIIEKAYNNIKIKIIFNSISFINSNNEDNPSIDGTEFIILIDIK